MVFYVLLCLFVCFVYKFSFIIVLLAVVCIEFTNLYFDYILLFFIMLVIYVFYNIFIYILSFSNKYSICSHVLETIWTVLPIVILCFISFPLLYLSFPNYLSLSSEYCLLNSFSGNLIFYCDSDPSSFASAGASNTTFPNYLSLIILLSDLRDVPATQLYMFWYEIMSQPSLRADFLLWGSSNSNLPGVEQSIAYVSDVQNSIDNGESSRSIKSKIEKYSVKLKNDCGVVANFYDNPIDLELAQEIRNNASSLFGTIPTQGPSSERGRRATKSSDDRVFTYEDVKPSTSRSCIDLTSPKR